MKKMRLFFLIIGSMFGFFVLTLAVLSMNSSVKSTIESYIIRTLSHDLDCSLSGYLESCNLVTGKLGLKLIRAASKKNEWGWTAKNLVISFSWLDFVRGHFFKLHLAFYDFEAHSAVYNAKNIPLLFHIKKWADLPAGVIPVAIKAVEIHRGALTGVMGKQNNSCSLFCLFSACVTPVKDSVHFDCIVEQGRLSILQRTIFTEIAGNLIIKINNHDAPGEFAGFCNCAFLQAQPHCAVSINWQDDDGALTIHSCSDDFDTKFDWNAVRTALTGSVKSAYIAYLSGFQKPELCADRLSYAFNMPYESQSQAKGFCQITCGEIFAFEGGLINDFDKQKILVSLSNKNLIPIYLFNSYVQGIIGSNDMYIRCEFDAKTGELTSIINAHVSEQAEAPYENSDLKACEKKLLIAMRGDFSLKSSLSGDKIRANFSFKDGQLSFPHIYNSVHAINIEALYDVGNKMLTVEKGRIDLTKGLVEISQGSPAFVNDKLNSYLFDLVLSDCFVHFKKEMAAAISGSIVLAKKTDADLPIMTGNLLIETGQVKSKFLSLITDQKSSVFGMMPVSFGSSFDDVRLDLKLRSLEPLSVHTSLLQSKVRCDLSFGGTILKPIIQGDMNFVGGLLQFPYQPLYITHGRVSFLPNQLNNPALEITAQNKIKKYTVTLMVSGFLKQPHISLESSPFLSEKQIVTLLLGGSDNGSLYMTVPALLTTTLKDLIFGSSDLKTQDADFQSGFVKKWMPSIRVIPGLKKPESGSDVLGALTIEVDDNIRATVQKNLNKAGESSVEVEYDLSDDMLIRAVKDEHGEIGAEIEKTWKFS